MRRTSASPTPFAGRGLRVQPLEDGEDLGQMRLRDAQPIILHVNDLISLKAGALVRTGANFDPPGPVGIQIIDRVSEQIGEDLFHGCGVAPDGRQFADLHLRLLFGDAAAHGLPRSAG